MSSNDKIMDSSSSPPPPPPNNSTTGLISPFAQFINTTSTTTTTTSLESDISLPLRTPQVDSYQISRIEQARARIKQSIAQSPLLLNHHNANNNNNNFSTTENNDNVNKNSTTTTSTAATSMEYIFPRFDKRELHLGQVLGSGGFGTVLEIRGIQLLCTDELLNNPHNDSTNTTTAVGTDKKKQKLPSALRRRPSRIKSRSYDVSETTTTTTTTNHSHNNKNHRKSPTRRNKLTKGIRTKALSWDAKAHDVLPDVGHFFHNKGVVEEETKVGGDDACGDEADSSVANTAAADTTTTNTVEDASTTNNATVNETEQQQTTEQQQSQPTRSVVRQISRNFSLKAWGDSEPGDEGKDAISQEEMGWYRSLHDSRHAGADGGTGTSTPLSNEDEEKDGCYEDCDLQHQTVCLVDEVGGVCPGTNHYLSTVLENADGQQQLESNSGGDSSSQFSVYDTVDDSRNNNNGNSNNAQQQEQEQLQCQHRRRIVFFQPLSNQDIQQQQQQQQEDKQYISENATTPTGESRYVIKIIQPEIVQSDFKKFLQAAMDMATETKFLSVLTHPHILKMRAVGQGDMFSPEYFLVLDRLYDTLLDRVEGSWKKQADHLENDFLVWNRASKVKMLWVERMSVMRDVAGALMYCHELGIIYRDIKPENIGFDGKGVVKLFDFGLAKEIRKEDESSNGTYKLTPNTGSLRYMAPEVGNKWPYNFLADTYSMGLMLWEVTSLNRPFEHYTSDEIRDMVMKWGERPKVKDDWPERVKQLMTSAWDSSFRKRPTMEAFRDALEKEVMEASLV